jgi:hypothetical protein
LVFRCLMDQAHAETQGETCDTTANHAYQVAGCVSDGGLWQFLSFLGVPRLGYQDNAGVSHDCSGGTERSPCKPSTPELLTSGRLSLASIVSGVSSK